MGAVAISSIRLAGSRRRISPPAVEGTVLYSSRAGKVEGADDGYWVKLGAIWPQGAYWFTRAEEVSGRCVVVEGTIHPFVTENLRGLIEVSRLAVWDEPNRPVRTYAPVPTESGQLPPIR